MSAGSLKRTVLNEWHRSHGANMVDFSGWDMPIHYRPGIIREHLTTRKYGGLFDISHMGRFRIRGKGAIPFLQHVLSNNAEAVEPNQAVYSLLPNGEGGVIDDTYLYRLRQEDYILVVNAANREKDWAHLQAQAKGFSRLSFEDHSEKLAMIAFQGPLAGQVLDGLVEGGALPEPMKNRFSEAVFLGTSMWVSRTGYTGEPVGFEIFPPASKVVEFWDRLCEIGGPMGILPVGLGARDTLRLEAGLPLHGNEFGTDPEGGEFKAFSFPLSSFAVSFSPRKGNYIGRDALLRQFLQVQKIVAGRYEPNDVLNRRTVPLAPLERGVIRHGDEVLIGERRIGYVTSGTVTPFWEFEGEGAEMRITEKEGRRAIALAWIDAGLRPEQEVDVLVRGRRLRAKIVEWHGRSEAPPYFRPIPVGWQKPVPLSLAEKGFQKAALLVRRSMENHEWRQRQCINLIPSEMTPSPLVRLLQVSDPVGRYAEHKDMPAAFDREVYYYQGTDFIKWVEEALLTEMREFLGAPLADVRPISGQMANMTVFSAIADFRNRIDRKREPERIRLVMNNHIGKGGHLSAQPMGALRDYVAKDAITERFAVVNFPVLRDNPYKIDLEETGRLLECIQPELIVFGKSMVLHPEPVQAVRNLVAGMKVRPILMYDMAHVLGLVGPHFQWPFEEGADIVTASTHKTFFGTQRGIIAANMEEYTPEFDLWDAIRRRAFPGMVSNHHLGTLLGLFLAAVEMNTFKEEYQPLVIANAKAFARALKTEGLDVQGDPEVDFTETHQVILRVGYAEGIRIARSLERNNIIVNYQALPSDESFTASSGLRMGVSEMTRFGMQGRDFEILAVLIADVVKRGAKIREEVIRLRSGFQQMRFCFEEKDLDGLKQKLLATF
ncbi:MAG: glycine cleavage system protein T [Deltaproteobacteria bacterium HGW-Deltaproteobacteria-15]|nr:MAG: glycine cleavage system protein T [Deltaproteobacteria bacterium HGW-Deltaproteobacteria-15]